MTPMEYSAGAVCYTTDGGERRYCIIRARDGVYGLPKGHLEKGETTEQAAVREVWEETSLHVALDTGFCHTIEYEMPRKRGVRKRVTFYVASFTGQTPHALEDELSGVMLLPYGEASRLLTHPDVRQTLALAHAYINTHQHNQPTP